MSTATKVPEADAWSGVEADASDVPGGYKRTAAGVIPDEWRVETLRTLLSQPATYGIVTAGRFVRSGVPMVRGGDIKGGVVSGDLPHVSHAKSEEFSRTVLQRGDLLIALVGYPGEAALCPPALVGANISRAVGLLRPIPGICATFLVAYLNSPSGRREFLKPGAGSAQLVVNLQDLNLLRIPLPPPPEQRAIAEALSDVDGLLGALEALIAKKRANKQAAMQQLLTGKTRLPEFSGEWETKRLGEVGSVYGGLTGKGKADFGSGDARYVTFLNVLNNVVIDPAGLDHVTVAQAESQNPVLRGDLLYNGTSETPGDLAMGAVVGISEPELFLNSFCFGFRIHDQERHSPLFYAYYFRGSPGRQLMYGLAQGATRYNMSKRQFKALQLPLPPPDEQSAIATVLSDMDTEITALERRREKTRAIKQGMMQQLLTGRVRLVEPEQAG